MIMLESRLILNVTVFAPEPLDDLLSGHTPEDRVVGPEPLGFLPGGDNVWTSLGFLLKCKDYLPLISNFDVFLLLCWSGHVSHPLFLWPLTAHGCPLLSKRIVLKDSHITLHP